MKKDYTELWNGLKVWLSDYALSVAPYNGVDDENMDDREYQARQTTYETLNDVLDEMEQIEGNE